MSDPVIDAVAGAVTSTATAAVVADATGVQSAPASNDVTVSETTTTFSLGVPVSDIEAVLAKYEHDIIGKAHAIFEDIKSLAAKAKAAVEGAV